MVNWHLYVVRADSQSITLLGSDRWVFRFSIGLQRFRKGFALS